MKKLLNTKIVLLIISIIILNLFLLSCTTNKENSQDVLINDEELLNVHFLNVGQGDSILIELSNGEISLIDGGNRNDDDYIINYIRKLNIEKIDYLIATHPHEDHIGSLAHIVNNFNIGKVYMPRKSANTKVFEEFITEINNKNIQVIESKGGQYIVKNEDVQYQILAPNSDKYDETNEYSVVTKLKYKDTSFIFTGDAEKVSEREMILKNYDLSSDVLKVGHHGGKTSTTNEFLERVKPKYAVISVGKDNDYGHPHSEVLERLRLHNTKIYRTDINGTIIATSNGEKITFQTEYEGEINKDNLKGNEKEEFYIGNKNTKVYHSPNCNSLPIKKNQIIFKTAKEAKEAGYRPHKICIE